jgi:hypothetical protein
LKTAAPAGPETLRRKADVALTRLLLLALFLALAVTGCGAGDERSGVAGPPQPPGTYAVGATVFGLPGGTIALSAPPVAPLAGWLTPAAVPSPDGRQLAYNVWKELRRDDPKLSWTDQGIEPGDPLATPSVRVHDLASGADALLEEGAFSLAWRRDGALAYFKGAERDYRAAVPYVGDVFVRSSLQSPPEVWSRQHARYIVAGWAGSNLVAYRESEGEALDVLVFEGPGRVRVLAANSGLVALSPDGRQAFLEQGPAQGRPSVRVLDIESGKQVARLDLTRVDSAVGTVGYAGDWRGGRVVAASASGLALFQVGHGRIVLEQAVRVPGQAVAEPRFRDTAGRRITAWTEDKTGTGVLLDCDRATKRCARLVPLPRARGLGGFPVWRRPVYNPSRPLASR